MSAGKTNKPSSTSQPALDSAYFPSDSGPALPPDPDRSHPALQQARAVSDLSASFTHNKNKPLKYGKDAATPPQGPSSLPPDPSATASTLSEHNASTKTNQPAPPGLNATDGHLQRVRADSSQQQLTTNQGVPVADNQHSLTAGLGGPALLKDFILREKLTHFDHERIPERIVHARGSAAHGYFESYEALTELTCASLFAQVGKRTPVFARFSTVAGERGSKDTARDVRGFAVKFYTDEGNWDLVGNNIPVFFIQDAMKFPDLVHALKPEPHHGMPQAASAHDTFWDFISLMPESIHTVTWQMSGRGIPRSYRMMQGFGVHTFRFVNAKGLAKFVKFHWTPLLGTHAHVWDEAVKISGADPDFHRRDLWEAIESGAYPEWELGVQIFDEEQAASFSFDVLDATKIIPEELVPVTPIGRMVLNRNPDNFFAETEQVAFCTAHVVPGIDFTNDPLLAGRIHSYQDTQLIRLGGPNFHEIPINGPLAPVHNNQRDGLHRQTINRGRVAYEPNSLAGGCPFQAGAAGGYMSFPEPITGEELRGKPEKFAEHYHQATLFYNSQAPDEQRHIQDAFVFELSKVTVATIRKRMVALLRNVSEPLAVAVAKELGMEQLPEPLPNACPNAQPPEITQSAFLSLKARPGQGGIQTRKIAIMVDEGINATTALTIAQGLIDEGAVVRLVGPRLGLFHAEDGSLLDADAYFSNSPSVLFDAIVIPDGQAAIETLSQNGFALEFIRDPFRHLKPMLVIGAGQTLLEKADIPQLEEDTGLLVAPDCSLAVMADFVQAIAQHRHPNRDQIPSPV